MSLTVLDESKIAEMAEKGVILGHKKSKTHPSMKPIIIDTKNDVELLDPQAVVESVESAVAFLKEKSKPGFLALFVGAIPGIKEEIKSFAEEFAMPYVTNRWLGGTLTNFSVISKQTRYYEDLIAKQERGELAKYTKKEQLGFTKEIEKMRENFQGLTRLTRLPDWMLVVDIREHDTAVREARKMKIPVVAIVDSDDNPELVPHPIYASDHSKESVRWVIEHLRKGLQEAAQVQVQDTQVK
ncbi:MAG: 30S ribosomal protein S2 [Candidatus Jorgensenbacteria bacterium GW2011_GWA1_48_13]|uniref:Small ribosomal subunit protein uS2 n=2 Tax=Candidatus Joergenseniibacteriota TaxID=1752739 RepID=A0A0G1YJ75_9BACT|nr:MAG: 30S ribosomal protein S2 [Candidatus Jorgensenbacteria bacterium GW2011_GWA1_48_13]KKU97960.1 MAG: 30S ribosomal protein S2 [Candidatus Jorgensenbacteria bacterium GW2011_GWC1_48_8]KKW15037.1 MAG: 30S ribosomal protein S2 [Candidatus Jorgensenbacteria bacterium GW2011_GWB1_50_10]